MKPSLIIMAAGMGSRYGGLKQIDPVDEYGNKIVDFSIYDAKRAGFDKIIFVIKEENLADFKEAFSDRLKDRVNIAFAFQKSDDIPAPFKVPEGRVKPWGTAQAVLSAKNETEGPVAVINADDFYGKEAFEKMYNFLTTAKDTEPYEYAMVGFTLRNTLTDNGYVSRGITEVNSDDLLMNVTERTHIEKDGNGAKYTEDDGKTWTALTGDEIVSMNFWGFGKSIMTELNTAFTAFLENLDKSGNPLKAECYLPAVVDGLIHENKATAKVLHSKDKWFGVTYKEDKENVTASIRELKKAGIYPEKLWD
ncbi:MAG: nucleotidyltransferase [Lachnospiraceae bacterium]|nr:nucleotidyltransferase [Lachnospiraceae bacterium]